MLNLLFKNLWLIDLSYSDLRGCDLRGCDLSGIIENDDLIIKATKLLFQLENLIHSIGG